MTGKRFIISKARVYIFYYARIKLVPSVYVFFILVASDSSAVALNSSPKNKKHIRIL